jgi:hypothetical protein
MNKWNVRTMAVLMGLTAFFGLSAGKASGASSETVAPPKISIVTQPAKR